MSPEKTYLKELKAYSNIYVSFGDGAKGIIKSMGKLVSPGFPSLALTANLINISELYDQGHNTLFLAKIEKS